MPKLTKKIVDSATAAIKVDVWLWDTEVHGFGVRVQPSGRKTYVTRYRTRAGIQRKQTVARCSDMPPERARDLARKLFAAVAEGLDPVAEKDKERESQQTVQELRDRYMSEYATPYKKPRSQKIDEINWRLHILPKIGKKRIRELTQAHIMTLHGGLSSMPAVGNQCLALLSKALNLAEMWDWREKHTNPCRGVKKFEIPERETILSIEQIQALNATLTMLVDSHEIRKPMADLVRLLLLTGCRLREIMHARREWIDKPRRLLLLPDSKVRQRRISLSPAAMAIIDGISEDETWLIPSHIKGKPINTPYKAWERIKEAAKLPEDLRMHDLRHTAGSLAHAHGLSQKQVAILLGHKQLSTTERYLHGQTGDGAMVMDALAEAISWAPASKPA